MSGVSVIIPTHNYGGYIVRSIRSVIDQGDSGIECIVVDDGSTDNTREIIFRTFGDRVKYFYQDNAGASAARNRGIDQSRGKFLIFLDADDVLGDDQVVSFLTCSKNNSDDIIFGPWLRYYEDTGKTYAPFSIENIEGGDLLKRWLTGFYIASCSIFWPRIVINNIGGWDERLAANQDGDVAMRALIMGYSFRYCHCSPALISSHSSELLSLSDKVCIGSLTSRLTVLRKVENLLSERNLLEAYRKPLADAYYSLSIGHVRNYPQFSRECYNHFRRLRGLRRPPGTALNWLFTSLLGIVNKEKLSVWRLNLLRRKRNQRKSRQIHVGP